MYCTSCGVELLPEAAFCISCGAPVNREAREAATVVESSPVAVKRRGVKWALISLVAVAIAGSGGYLYVNKLAQDELNALLAQIESKVTLTYTDASANPLTRAMTIEGINITSVEGQPIEGVTIDRLQVKGAADRNADPEEIDVRVQGLKLDIARLGPKWGEPLMMNAGSIVIDSHLDYRFSRKAGELAINEFELAAQDLATLRISLDLADVAAEVESPAQALAHPATSIRRGELRISDAVLIDHLLQKTAEKQGTSPEKLRQQLTAMLPAILGDSRGGLETELSAALVQLINQPNTAIRLTVAPATPVTVADIKAAGEPARQLELLNVRVDNGG